MNLLTFLMTGYLTREAGSLVSPIDADSRLHAVDALLAPQIPGAPVPQIGDEAQLLASYLQLGVEDLDSIPPTVHEWFVERLCLTTDVPDVPRLAERVARIYFLGAGRLSQYLSINALLVIDERFDAVQTHVEAVWRFILVPDNFPDRNKPEMLDQVAEILLDLCQLTTNPGYAESALGQLWLALDGHREAREQVADRVRARAEATGGERGRRLASLAPVDDRY